MKKYNFSSPLNFQAEAVGFAFVKSGYEAVLADLQDDFMFYGLETIHAARVVLHPTAIDYFYRDSLDKHFYPDMRRHLATSAITTLTLLHQSQNAQQLLCNLKTGSGGYENLRTKYHNPRIWIQPDEIALWERGEHPNQYETTVTLTQDNVFHAADTTDEALKSIKLLEATSVDFYTPAERRSAQIGRLARLLSELGN